MIIIGDIRQWPSPHNNSWHGVILTIQWRVFRSGFCCVHHCHVSDDHKFVDWTHVCFIAEISKAERHIISHKRPLALYVCCVLCVCDVDVRSINCTTATWKPFILFTFSWHKSIKLKINPSNVWIVTTTSYHSFKILLCTSQLFFFVSSSSFWRNKGWIWMECGGGGDYGDGYGSKVTTECFWFFWHRLDEEEEQDKEVNARGPGRGGVYLCL